jgi:hypothetical protein
MGSTMIMVNGAYIAMGASGRSVHGLHLPYQHLQRGSVRGRSVGVFGSSAPGGLQGERRA